MSYMHADPFCRPFDIFLAILLIFLGACSSTPPSSPSSFSSPTGPSSAPFFTPSPQETKFYRTLIREQDEHLRKCAHDHTCDRAHFTRALTALYENQAVAAKHFQEIVQTYPKSPLAPLSGSWLRLLQESSSSADQRYPLLSQMTQWMIRDLLYKEQVARRELTNRDRKLAELSAQIEALKQIDREIKEKSHQIRPRAKGLSENGKVPEEPTY